MLLHFVAFLINLLFIVLLFAICHFIPLCSFFVDFFLLPFVLLLSTFECSLAIFHVIDVIENVDACSFVDIDMGCIIFSCL